MNKNIYNKMKYFNNIQNIQNIQNIPNIQNIENITPIHFCTFGNTGLYSKSIELLKNEALSSNYFNSVTVYNEFDIPTEYKNFVQENKRGYGYWIWKPIILLDMFSKKKPNDIIIYADAGCAISTTESAKKYLIEWINILKEHETKRIGFLMSQHIEETWTKMDLFNFMDCNDDKYKLTPHYSASIQIYMNTEDNIKFITEQLRIMSYDNFHYITDAQSYIPNSEKFKDYRHDQSILSLLYKKYGCAIIEDHWADYSRPIVTIRRKFF
jgi:hypothetical protein